MKPAHPEFLQKSLDQFFLERVAQEWEGQWVFNGRKPDAASIMMISNDYLCLADHPEVIRAQKASLANRNTLAVVSAVFLGYDSDLHQFEKEMAQYMGAEASLVGGSGYAVNAGVIQALSGKDVPVYIDQRAHASLWEGIFSAGAKAVPFKHNQPHNLVQCITQEGPGLIVVDAVYSTDGNICPLTEIVDISQKYNCPLVVDESHSLGIYGPEGAGLVSALGLESKVQVRTASLAKTFASRGGIVVGTSELITYIMHTSKSHIFSSSVLPIDIATFAAALKIIARDDWRREKLITNADYLRRGLARAGFNVSASKAPIISLEVGPELKTISLKNALEKNNIFGSPFLHPTTSKKRSLIRFTVNSSLEIAQLDKVIQVCSSLKDEFDYSNWTSSLKAVDSSLAVRSGEVVS